MYIVIGEGTNLETKELIDNLSELGVAFLFKDFDNMSRLEETIWSKFLKQGRDSEELPYILCSVGGIDDLGLLFEAANNLEGQINLDFNKT